MILVVNYLARCVHSIGKADLAQTADTLGVCHSALLPCFAFIKSLGIFFHSLEGLPRRPGEGKPECPNGAMSKGVHEKKKHYDDL